MNLAKKLKKISEKPSSEILVKRYLLDCCEKLRRFRSSDCLAKNLLVARKFLRGVATQKQIHQAEWEIEAEAFGAEYFSEKGARVYFRVDKNISADLIKVRISKGLSNRGSRQHLVEMAYFIDRVFCHVEYSSNWLFTEECEQFMCPKLFVKYFGMAA
ncbi:hypothetical protein J8L98_24195 [Pseudoalteromonas sp. MMG013]|uniref:hypothetical protein n=1 Tax=Pseudoalteromonas sp. MMG013 TaxID=2822687 RepID=UPI001B3810F7|nr:hypothetical protein [Pseudoalteromonas sp. MMG013]MBQ4864790.1 hypothetical protein [Pseudoalteromonas sp. MMG013]